MLTVLLVDDHPLVRDGLALALASHVPGLDVVALATPAAAEAALAATPERFDLVLVDQRLPDSAGGLAWACRLRLRHPALPCALLSGSEDALLGVQAAQAGLAGFLSKGLDVATLARAVIAIAGGGTWFAATGPAPGDGLTPRQLEILALAARGVSTKAIARELAIAPATVRNHFAQIFERLGAHSRMQAVALTRAGAADRALGDGDESA